MKTLEFITFNPEEQIEICELTRVPEVLKEHTDSCYRSAFFSEDNKKNCFGPLTLTFAIRTAKDILEEGCEYQDTEIKLETSGHVLPALPAYSEIQKYLETEDTYVHINGHIYKPNSEVYGFQQVYDDAVKCIDNLKKIGFTNESMVIYATPDDITVEVSNLALGIEGNEELPSRYYKLLCYLAEIKEVKGRPQKTSVKTILLNTTQTNSRILLPGSIHPKMKRVKVAVGASHFAYGIAAFSDTCVKKRTQEECIQETLNWLNFLEKEQKPVSGIRELLDKLPKIALPSKSSKVATSISSVASTKTDKPKEENDQISSKSFIGVFQPLKNELEDANNDFKNLPSGINAFNSTLDKVLGHGWSIGGLHIILGNREKGKASLLLQQTIISENKMPVLYISYEQSLREFVVNSSTLVNGINKTELIAGMTGPNAEKIKATFGVAVDKLQTKLTNNLYFSGVEAGRTSFNPDEILELASMLPESQKRLIVIESVNEEDFFDNINEKLQKLKAAAMSKNYIILMSIHVKEGLVKRPNYIEEFDIDYLAKYQRFSDTIININTDKTNLRRFVALVKGQVDNNLITNLEQKALQFSGGKRLKNDTYSLLRLIHNRNGRRDMILMLYQPDMGRFFELATVPLSRA